MKRPAVLEYAPSEHQRLALASGLAVECGLEDAPRRSVSWAALATGLALGIAATLGAEAALAPAHQPSRPALSPGNCSAPISLERSEPGPPSWRTREREVRAGR